MYLHDPKIVRGFFCSNNCPLNLNIRKICKIIRCISRKKEKTNKKITRTNISRLSISIITFDLPLTTPTSQLTIYGNKKEKRKKRRKIKRRRGETGLPVKNLIRRSDRRSITVSRAGERPGIRVNHVGSIEQRSTNGRSAAAKNPPSLSRWSAFAARKAPAR